jgi:DNA-binding MarR family transcriptional regulator
MKTARRRHSPTFDSLQQEAYLSLWRTYDRLRPLEDKLFQRFELTPQQYNLLRLLEAAGSDAVPSAGLASKLVSRAPDVTRMLDRLEERKLIARSRTEADRRSVLVGITPAGVALLAKIAEPLAECHRNQLGHLSQADLKQLVQLLARARAPHEPDGSRWK